MPRVTSTLAKMAGVLGSVVAGAGCLGGAVCLPLLPVHPRVGRHRRHAAGVCHHSVLPLCQPTGQFPSAFGMLVTSEQLSTQDIQHGLLLSGQHPSHTSDIF